MTELLIKVVGCVLLLGGSYMILEALWHMDAPKPSKRKRKAYL